MTIEEPTPPKPQDPEPVKPPEPEPVTVEPQEAKNPLEEKVDRLENGINQLLAKQDEREKRERAGARTAKFKAHQDSKGRSVPKQDKETEGSGNTRTKGNDRGIQRETPPAKRTRFRFRHKSKPGG